MAPEIAHVLVRAGQYGRRALTAEDLHHMVRRFADEVAVHNDGDVNVGRIVAVHLGIDAGGAYLAGLIVWKEHLQDETVRQRPVVGSLGRAGAPLELVSATATLHPIAWVPAPGFVAVARSPGKIDPWAASAP